MELRRFRFVDYMEAQLGAVGWLPREEYNALKANSTGLIEIPASRTPLAGIEHANLIALTLTPSTGPHDVIEAFRLDPRDEPPINVYRWIVPTDILGRPDYLDLVAKCSTSDSPPLREVLTDFVPFIEQPRGAGHWGRPQDCPPVVLAKLRLLSFDKD